MDSVRRCESGRFDFRFTCLCQRDFFRRVAGDPECAPPAKTLRKALTPPHLASPNAILAKYYIRFITSGFIIFVFITGHFANPAGQVLGLSVVVVSIILATLREAKHLIFKEAV
ncbi:MAG: hypothetical protein WCA42_14555 [Desulfobacterales bacterium]